MKIDQEDFNRKAQHILDTVVRPQVERYEKAKAEGTLVPKPRQVGAAGFVADEYASKITLSYFRSVYKDFVDEKITMSRMVELLNEQANREQDDRIL
jgi:hypothetical protein